MPSFSVIIPCFNRTQYLQEAITSVLNQTFTSFEIILVDDGSDENHRKVIETISDQESRIQLVVVVENKGVSHARNIGLKHAQGDFVCFLDDDDRLAATFLQVAIASFEQQPDIDIALCQSSVDPKSKKSLFRYHTLKETLRSQPSENSYRKDNASLLYQYPPQINSLVFRRKIFLYHHFDPSLRIGEDIYLWFKLLETGYQFGKKQSRVPQAFIKVHGDVQLSAADHQKILDFQHRLKTDFQLPDPSLETLIDFKLFMRHALMGNLKSALHCLWLSFKHPKSFIKIAVTQSWLKLRIMFSYALYKTMKIDL